MKKLLYQLDTDLQPSVFDNVVAHDGGADQVMAYGGVNPGNVAGMVDGAIFTRAPDDKRFTALFVGGSRMADGEALLAAIQARFFANFRVSVMLDSNGSNTTAAAAVAWFARTLPLQGVRAVVLAGTGPVGQRAAVMMAREGADVAITSRRPEAAQAIVAAIHQRFGVRIEALPGATPEQRSAALQGAQVAFATGASGVTLLAEDQWKDHPTLRLLADANATPPAGIEGLKAGDRAKERHGRITFGALGFGALKIALHRACVARLFERNDQVLDAEEIYALARQMVASA